MGGYIRSAMQSVRPELQPGTRRGGLAEAFQFLPSFEDSGRKIRGVATPEFLAFRFCVRWLAPTSVASRRGPTGTVLNELAELSHDSEQLLVIFVSNAWAMEWEEGFR